MCEKVVPISIREHKGGFLAHFRGPNISFAVKENFQFIAEFCDFVGFWHPETLMHTSTHNARQGDTDTQCKDNTDTHPHTTQWWHWHWPDTHTIQGWQTHIRTQYKCDTDTHPHTMQGWHWHWPDTHTIQLQGWYWRTHPQVTLTYICTQCKGDTDTDQTHTQCKGDTDTDQTHTQHKGDRHTSTHNTSVTLTLTNTRVALTHTSTYNTRVTDISTHKTRVAPTTNTNTNTNTHTTQGGG